jgi:hypothetical protein
VFGVGHHDWFNAFQEWDEPIVEEVLHDPLVIIAIEAVRRAAGVEEKVGALNQLMERLE